MVNPGGNMSCSMEVEYDSEEDLQDVEGELNTWLAQLSDISTVHGKGEKISGGNTMPSNTLLTQSHTMESFRYSVMMDLDGGGAGGDLDDIISDLCALEAELTDAQKELHVNPPLTDGDSGNVEDMYNQSGVYNSTGSSLSHHTGEQLIVNPLPPPLVPRTFSHDSGLSRRRPVYNGHVQFTKSEEQLPAPTAAVEAADPAERDQRMKEEKIRIAIQKIKDADIKKLFVKIFIQTGDCKTILVDENMTINEVMLQLYDKCGSKPNVRWTLVEQIPDLFMERILEDHEKLVMVMMNWLKISNNKILFLETDDKYDLFFQPQLPPHIEQFTHSQHGLCLHHLEVTALHGYPVPNRVVCGDYVVPLSFYQKYLLSRDRAEKCSEKEAKALIGDLFGGAGTQVPELEGEMYCKVDGQKIWKKTTIILRTSGLYTRKGKSSRNLQCVVQFDQVEIFRGFGWRKKFKSPSEHCFALKHARIQKKSKEIRYFCCEDEYTLKKWLMGMRIAKYGQELHNGFKQTLELVSGGRKVSSANADTPSDSMSQSSRDSGFSVTSDSSNSLDLVVRKPNNEGLMPPPPDEFSDLPPPPPELLGEEQTPTNTPVHFAQMTDAFQRMQSTDSASSSCSSLANNSTPRNSVSSGTSSASYSNTALVKHKTKESSMSPSQSFERHSGIRNSLRRGQAPTPPKQVAPPRVPPATPAKPAPPQPQNTCTRYQQHYQGHYGYTPQSVQSASSLPPPPPANHVSNGFMSELSSIYARKGLTPSISSESDSDVDDLPPPPPELLAPTEGQMCENPYDVPMHYNHTRREMSSVPLQYNPYTDRQTMYGTSHYGTSQNNTHRSPARETAYSMGRVFASQTGTIKRAPPPPPKRNDATSLSNDQR